MEEHKDLWDVIESAIRAKGFDKFRVHKVKGHATLLEVQGEAIKTKERRRNEGADEEAVQGAISHEVPRRKILLYKHDKAMITKMQWMMIEMVFLMKILLKI